MFISIILLIIGFIILIKSADIFVDGASSMARNYHLSTMFIGLTIVAFGTSAPELAISISSFISHNTDMVVGNVLGSNILNILLILGLASVISPLVISENTVKKEIPIVILLTTILIILMSDLLLSRIDGLIIILFFGIFIYHLITMLKNKDNSQDAEKPQYNLKFSYLYTILGIIGIVIGSKLVVNNATNMATYMGISQRLISLTIVALGTSLPELVTSVMAAIKKESDIAIGNIVGSNIFNLGMVLGLPIVIFGQIPMNEFKIIDAIFVLLSVIVLFIFSLKDHKLKRYEGIILLILFIIYYSYIIFI